MPPPRRLCSGYGVCWLGLALVEVCGSLELGRQWGWRGGSRLHPVEWGGWVQIRAAAPSRRGLGARVAGWAGRREETQPCRVLGAEHLSGAQHAACHYIAQPSPSPGSLVPAQCCGLPSRLIWSPPPVLPPLCGRDLFSLAGSGHQHEVPGGAGACTPLKAPVTKPDLSPQSTVGWSPPARSRADFQSYILLFCHIQGMWSFPGWELNLRHSSGPSHSSDTRSLAHCPTREL